MRFGVAPQLPADDAVQVEGETLSISQRASSSRTRRTSSARTFAASYSFVRLDSS